MHTQSPVAFAISSPTFFGERPRGPIFGASAEEAPTSPPVALRWLCDVSTYFECEIVGFQFLVGYRRIDAISRSLEAATYMILISFGSSFGAG
jgi:hypothetical protein